MTDLLIRNAALVATVDSDRRELPGGWVAITDGLSGPNWRVGIKQLGDQWVHELVGTQVGPASSPMKLRGVGRSPPLASVA